MVCAAFPPGRCFCAARLLALNPLCIPTGEAITCHSRLRHDLTRHLVTGNSTRELKPCYDLFRTEDEHRYLSSVPTCTFPLRVPVKSMPVSQRNGFFSSHLLLLQLRAPVCYRAYCAAFIWRTGFLELDAFRRYSPLACDRSYLVSREILDMRPFCSGRDPVDRPRLEKLGLLAQYAILARPSN